MMDATSGGPIGRPNWNPSGKGPGKASGAQQPGQVFPRSGWSDAASLSTRARNALNTLQNDYGNVFNWRRRPGGFNPKPGFPDMAAMYGMAYPPKNDIKPLPSNPTRPPDVAAMYGLAFPPKDNGPILPTNPTRPPDVAAMYGLAFPPKDNGQPGFPVRPPDVAAMYGMAFPPNDGGFPSPTNPPLPPDVAAMYGMAYPRNS